MQRIVELLKRDVDRSLLRENLKLTPDQRVRRMMALQGQLAQFRKAGALVRSQS